METCSVCKESIVGTHIATLTDKYHSECFRCHHCLQEFKDNVFFEEEGHFYCEDDHAMLYLARCGKCAEVIQGKCINALDNKWHIEHFVCENCGRSLVGTNFVRKDDKPYCKLCPTDKEQAKQKKLEEYTDFCEMCKLPIQVIPLLYKGKKYHPNHYHCIQCEAPLDSKSREFNGDLYCFTDYEKIMSQVCHSCRLPIIGVTVSALGRVYHPEHFVCTKCDKPFNGTQYFEDEGKPYCELHYKEVTGALCQFCRKAVKGKMISALGSKWCEAHFMCMGCFAPLNDFERSKFMDFDTKPFCRRCYDKLPSDTKRNTKKYAESEKKYLPTPA